MTSQHHPMPVLSDDEAASRMRLLADLRAALSALGIQSLLARRQRLVLVSRYMEGPFDPSGLTDPQLHVFLPSGALSVTTDGVSYRLAKQKFPVEEPSAAAAAIRATRPAPC